MIISLAVAAKLFAPLYSAGHGGVEDVPRDTFVHREQPMPPLLQLIVFAIAVVMSGIAYDLAKKQGIDIAQVLLTLAKKTVELLVVCVLYTGAFALVAILVLSLIYPVMVVVLSELREDRWWVAKLVASICVISCFIAYLIFISYLQCKKRQSSRINSSTSSK